jgi:hypothetical protein
MEVENDPSQLSRETDQAAEHRESLKAQSATVRLGLQFGYPE